MGYSRVAALVLAVLLATTAAAVLLPVQAESRTIVVPDDYLTIQEGVNHANPRDTVLVKPGTYFESVVLSQTVRLVGLGNPVINANRKSCPITINASNCVVNGFNVTNAQLGSSEAGTERYVKDFLK